MIQKLLLGPLLGIERDNTYTVCFLTNKKTTDPQVIVDGQAYDTIRIQGTPQGVFWRSVIPIHPSEDGRFCSYHIQSDETHILDNFRRDKWTFFVPGSGDGERPRIAYASCNGFSSGDAKNKLDEPYRLWKHMVQNHEQAPFALLIMGGDQLYADEIFESRRAPSVSAWAQRARKERIRKPAGPGLHRELDRFYEDLYLRHWRQEDMALMMASIPSIMMWDDHDIFDGWGSYPEDIQQCPYYQAIFNAARNYFQLFQIRSRENKTLLNPDGGHYSFGLNFYGYGILGLDNRSNRTESIVMNDQNWADVKTWLKGTNGKHQTLMVMSAVPVVFRDFARSESVFELTPWEEEVSDDLRDHWRSKHHEAERMRLIINIIDHQLSSPNGKRVILSGDVHVGSFGIIRDRRKPDAPQTIYQVVSTPIVHPAPTWYEWLGILAGSNDEPERLLDGQMDIEIIKPYGANKFLRTRNYTSLQEGTDGKLWVNWVCEDGTAPVHPID